VVSPLLANGYLHDVFDQWVEAWRKRSAPGDMAVVRCADDGVLGFDYRTGAGGLATPPRTALRRFGLELPTEKTRLIAFGPQALAHRKQRGEGQPDTFAFVGFTHSCERHRQTGDCTVRRTTARQRRGATLKALNQQRRQRRHEPTAITGQWLGSIVHGSFNDHAVPGNMRTLGTFRRRVIRLWRRQLRLRSQQTRLNWRRFTVLIHRWLPTQRILHPFPSVRFDAMHPR
jgi:hypothetical protein